MAAGLMFLVKKGATTIAAVRTVSLSMDATPIDISSYDSAGVQELLATAAQKILTLNVAGLESDHVLRDIALGSGSLLISDLTITFQNALTSNDVLACSFFMTNYKEDGDYKDAGLFTATFTSSGVWTRA